MKNFLLAILLGTALPCSAAETLEFSYANGCDDYLGTQKKETYDVAVYLPASRFKDFRVVSVKSPVNKSSKGTYDCYDGIQVWIASELKVEEKKIVTDVCYPAAITDDGYVNLELPEAYTITDKGAYVGFTINVNSRNTGSNYPIGIGAPMNPNGFFMHTSVTYGDKWVDIASANDCSLAMTIGVQTGNLEGESLSFVNVPEFIAMQINTEKTVDMTVATFGGNPVSSVDMEITADGKTSSIHYDLPEAFPSQLGASFVIPVNIPGPSSIFEGEARFKIAKVNGLENKAAENATATSMMKVYKVVPKHQALFEEYTGTWCGWCTRGYAALAYIKENYPDFVVAAYHDGDSDPMAAVSEYPNSPGGFPAAYLNRSMRGDPYDGTKKYNTILPVADDILEINNTFTPWEIKIAHTWDNDSTLTANVDVTCYENMEDDFKIAYILVADGLSGEGVKWRQTNNYSSSAQSADYIPQLNDFCRGGKYGKSPVAGLVFDDVVITDQGIYGIAGSLPSIVRAEEVMSHSFTFDLGKIDPALIPDKNKLRIIATVLDGNNKSLNCAKHEVNDYTGAGVEGIGVSDNDAPVEFYNLNGVKVSDPSNGIYVRRQGSRTSKVVIE